MQNKKILIVEDDPDVRLGMRIRLEANHYDTFVAGDVDSAVLGAQQHAPDLILLDVMMGAVLRLWSISKQIPL